MFLGLDISAGCPAHRDGTRPRSIVAFGDSLTAGAGASSSDHSPLSPQPRLDDLV